MEIDQCWKFKHRRFLGSRLNQPLQVKTRYGVSRAADEEFLVNNGVSATFMCQRSSRQMCALANALVALLFLHSRRRKTITTHVWAQEVGDKAQTSVKESVLSR